MYLRKSTESDDRQALSIPAQEKELIALAHRMDLNVVAAPMRESMSAKRPGRPVFADMLATIRKERADGILCWHLDRLARNPLDGGELMWMLGQGTLKEIATPGRTFTGTGDDKLMMSIIFGMATKYSDDLSVNVKRGQRQALESGQWIGSPKLGYVRDPYTKQMLPDPDRFHLVQSLWRMRLSGTPVLRILEHAREVLCLDTPRRSRIGGKLVVHSQLFRMFRDPFYAGLMVHSGNTYHGKHQPMLSFSEFESIRGLSALPTPAPKTRTFPYRGLVVCGACGALVTAEETVNRQGRSYTYYHCARKLRPFRYCPEPSIQEAELETQYLAFLDKLHLPDTLVRFLLDRAQDLARDTRLLRIQQKKQLEQQLDKLRTRRRRLLELCTDNVLSAEDYKTANAHLVIQVQRLLDKAAEPVEGDWTALEPLRDSIRFSIDARSAFLNGDKQKRRDIIATTSSNLSLRDKRLQIEPRKIFRLYAEMAKLTSWQAVWPRVRMSLATVLLEFRQPATPPYQTSPPQRPKRPHPPSNQPRTA